MLRYTVVLLSAPEGGFLVHVPAIPGCFTEGDTVEDALDAAKDVIESLLAVRWERGEDMPTEIAPAIVAAVDVPNVAGVKTGSAG